MKPRPPMGQVMAWALQWFASLPFSLWFLGHPIQHIHVPDPKFRNRKRVFRLETEQGLISSSGAFLHSAHSAGTARAQRQLLRCLSREHPCKPPPYRGMHDPFQTASGVQHSGPWDPWLPAVENSFRTVFAQRTVRPHTAVAPRPQWTSRPPPGRREFAH